MDEFSSLSFPFQKYNLQFKHNGLFGTTQIDLVLARKRCENVCDERKRWCKYRRFDKFRINLAPQLEFKITLMHDHFDAMSYTSGIPRRHSINFYFPFVTVNACNEIYAAVPQSIALFMYLLLSTVALFVRIDFFEIFLFFHLSFADSSSQKSNAATPVRFWLVFAFFFLYLFWREMRQSNKMTENETKEAESRSRVRIDDKTKKKCSTKKKKK